MKSRLKALIPTLSTHHIIVVGDVILDEYVMGQTTRLSREAPIPVLEFESRRLIPGGAANPAANITALGSHVLQMGVVGADSHGEHLRALLAERGIDTTGILTDQTRPTTVKMRLMAHMGLRFPQQVARLDTLSRAALSEDLVSRLAEIMGADSTTYQAILVSDYHCGLVTPRLLDTIRSFGALGSRLITADAQGSLEKYHHFDLVKCNADEARAYLRRDLRTDTDFATAAAALCTSLALKRAMIITRGGEGMTFATPDGIVEHCPAPEVSDVYDTVGAGDTAIAVLTLALLMNANVAEAAALANLASGVVVRRVGNYTPTQAELLVAVEEM